MGKEKYFSFCLGVVVLLLAAGCNTRDGGRAEEIQLPSAEISVVSGNNQRGRNGEQLDEPLVIRLTDEAGNPLSGISLALAVVEGSGHVVGASTLATDNRGRIKVLWEIGAGYNGIQVSMAGARYEAPPAYVYATGENPSGMFKTRSIASLTRVDEKLYTMTFYGEYDHILDEVNERYIHQAAIQPRQCSYFAALGDSGHYFFGRSYDNPIGWNCLTLVGRYYPTNGYASLALSRMRDYGFEVLTDFDRMGFHTKLALFEAAFYTPDGINEHGVSVACAGVRTLTYEPDPNKKYIWITRFVREVLDHAANVDEAIRIANRHNIFDSGFSSLGTHFLVADPSGRSVILELGEGRIQAVPNDRPWQVASNSPVFQVPLSERLAACPRFRTLWEEMEAAAGNITWEEGMGILSRVTFTPPGTQWSSLYDLIGRNMTLALNCDFERIYHFSFESIAGSDDETAAATTRIDR